MKQFSQDSITDAVDGLRAIGHEIRLAVLCHLVDGPRNVSELVELVGTTQSSLSQHLAKMRIMRIVSAERRGMQVYYKLAEPGFARIINALRSIYCPDHPGN